MKKYLISMVALALAGTALSADPAALYTKCAACHGGSGEKAALNKSKIIKDMTHADFVAAMKGYQDGSYGGAMKVLMVAQVKDLSADDIEALAGLIVK